MDMNISIDHTRSLNLDDIMAVGTGRAKALLAVGISIGALSSDSGKFFWYLRATGRAAASFSCR